MSRSVDTSHIYSKTPSIKKRLSEKITVNGITENVFYIIENISEDSPLLVVDNENSKVPYVGERISIHYDFSPYDGYYSYEFLSLFIFRNYDNYVRYFKNIGELEVALKSLTLRLDKEYAVKEIAKLSRQINELNKTYELN